MLLQSTLLIKEAQWIQMSLLKIFGTKQSNSCTKQDRMQSGHIKKANDLYLLEPIEMSKISCTYMCLHDLLCQCGARIRITVTKRKLILEFKGTYDKNSHPGRLCIMHAGS
jgi:hypothetical protein